MPTLKAPLPDHLDWLTERVEGLVRPAAFLVSGARQPKTHAPLERARVGGTFTDGEADMPADAAWAHRARSAPAQVGNGWMTSPYDGESFVIQLNLEDIPHVVRAQFTHLPPVGMVWVTIDLSKESGWEGRAYFDPRSALDIVWSPRQAHASVPAASSFVVQDTMTCCTDETLPEIASNYHGGVGMGVDFDDWWQTHYAGRQPSDIQLGGWMHPIQGDADVERRTLVMAIERQEFGDSGAVYLHYSPDRGFFVDVTTC